MDPYEGYLQDFEEEFREEQRLLNRQPIVLQLGMRFIRLGIAGVCTPHCVMDAPLLNKKNSLSLSLLPAAAAAANAANAANTTKAATAAAAGTAAATGTAAAETPAAGEPAQADSSSSSSSSSTSSSSSSSSCCVRTFDILDGSELKHKLAAWLLAALRVCCSRSIGERSLLLLEGPLTPLHLKTEIVKLLLNYFKANPKP